MDRFGVQLWDPSCVELPERAASDVRFPDLRVNLTHISGNAYQVIGAVRQAMMRHRPRIDGDLIEEFTDEARGTDYDNVLQTVLAWVDAYVETGDE